MTGTIKEQIKSRLYVSFVRFTNSSRTTGTTIIHIGDKRLTIVIATTGGKLMKNMKNWVNSTGFDGSHNRFLYMSIPKLTYSRPQEYSSFSITIVILILIFYSFQFNVHSKKNPSFTHLCVISHLFGTVRYVFRMSEAERTKFCGGNDDQ